MGRGAVWPFYGCFDWHSSVHGHWLLARLVRLHPDAAFAPRARAALARSLTPEHVAAEVAYLRGEGRASFERPYGLAWLLTLAAELRRLDDPYPIRIGEHGQTAFAFGLVADWARVAGDEATRALLESRARAFYEGDRACPLAHEPSGEDFLSPCLSEADLMRRILPAAAFSRWLGRFLPVIPTTGGARWLPPASSPTAPTRGSPTSTA